MQGDFALILKYCLFTNSTRSQSRGSTNSLKYNKKYSKYLYTNDMQSNDVLLDT